MSKMQKIWDEAFPVKPGQMLPSGTEFIEADFNDNATVAGLTLATLVRTSQAGGYDEGFVRTLEPLPDTDDTGEAYFIVEDNGDILMYNREHSSRYGATLTGQQARNFARKLLEALDA